MFYDIPVLMKCFIIIKEKYNRVSKVTQFICRSTVLCPLATQKFLKNANVNTGVHSALEENKTDYSAPFNRTPNTNF